MSDTIPRLSAALADRYRIERELGQGGMATVYLAQDLKHDRKVAIKVLRTELAAVIGAERFLREIKTIATLQHPHILGLIDSGEVQGTAYYVMPFVEGESLRDRLTREKQLPISDAVRIATEVASALDYAHRHGVIHRDIKPENILLHDGQALVADFGIALAVSTAGGSRMTETGMSLGTPQYMSPEQAMGERALDARTDIYSVGCVTYEMLLGEPPFTGPTAQAIFAKVMTSDPAPPTAQRKSIPAAVEDAVLTALQKLPADRWPSAAVFVDALSGRTPSRGVTAPKTVTSRPGPWRRNLPLGAVWLISLGVVAVLTRRLQPAPADTAVRQWNLALPDSAPVALSGPAPLGIWQRAIAISRQGDAVAYVATLGQTNHLYVRRLDEQSVHVIPGTEGAFDPFFSPDGRWIGFFAGGDLRKVSVEGGSTVTLASGLFPQGGDWITRDSILVANIEGSNPLWVSAAGGTPSPAVIDTGTRLVDLVVLTDHRYALGSLYQLGVLGARSLETGRVFVLTARGLVPPDSAASGEMIRGASPRYLASGHLVYMMPGDGVLAAMPFDPVRMKPLGPPVAFVSGVRQEASYQFGQFDISDDGTLVYVPGHNAELGVLEWVGSGGAADTLPFPRSSYNSLSLSPDGLHAIVARRLEAGNLRERILLDLARQQESRPWDDPTRIWRIVFWMDRTSVFRCCGLDARPQVYNVATQATRPLPKPVHEVRALSPDGGWWFSIAKKDGASQTDGFLASSLDSIAAPQSIGPAGWSASFSPDGRWLAFTVFSSTSIVVVHVPFDGRRFEISADGGDEPRWLPDGHRIVYKRGPQFMVVDVDTRNDRLVAGRPRPWLTGPFFRVGGWAYDVGPDGRLLVIAGPRETSAAHLNVMSNFGSMVRRLARVGGGRPSRDPHKPALCRPRRPLPH